MNNFIQVDSRNYVIAYGTTNTLPEGSIEVDTLDLIPICAPGYSLVFDEGLFKCIYTKTESDALEEVRVQRDRLLQASDWTQLPDVPLAAKEAWAIYRQELRDVTLQPDPFNIIWPQPPQ